MINEEVKVSNEVQTSASIEPETMHTCRTCGQQFRMTAKHEKWYADRHLVLPTHCPKCRKERKENQKKDQ